MPLEFPYQKNSTQEKLAEEIQNIIQTHKIGFLEAPTGTGKTLAVLHTILVNLRQCTPNPLQPTVQTSSYRRIVFSSRTLHQINQIMGELKKLMNYGSNKNTYITGTAYCSKSALCINSLANPHNSSNEYTNEYCKILRNSSKCPYYDLAEIKNIVDSPSGLGTSFKSNFLTDIEDLSNIGKKHGVCPYYLAKQVSKKADIIAVPYQFVTDKQTLIRKLEGLSDTLVVFDEAHNLPSIMESYNNVTLDEEQIANYITSIENKKTDPTYSKFLSNLSTFLANLNESETSYKINDFIDKINALDINFYRTQKIINNRKGYLEKINMATENKGDIIRNKNSFEKIKTTCGLLAKNSDNVFVKTNKHKVQLITRMENESLKKDKTNTSNNSMSIFCMDIAKPFEYLKKNAPSIIFISGTLTPTSYYSQFLLNQKNVFFRSLPHIIEKKQCLTLLYTNSLIGKERAPMNFTFKTRENLNTIKHISLFITNIEKFINGGIICFFQTKNYLKYFVDKLNELGHLKKLLKARKLFIENRDNFSDYKEAIGRNEKCILFAISNGKLSEGIDFKDNLCRCCIIIGIPFPDVNDPVLKYKNTIIENYYKQVCMKSINQTLGRSIRHKEDYAINIMIDSRASELYYMNSFSQHVKDRIQLTKEWTFGQLINEIRNFFHSNENCS
eukprot:GAHX01001009.1.p1 GENE.GAHX01001009.1~~GAHX01001009.1.p1  ORF type:complete len:672 (-),score=116.19 GAHX01001009.1:799-2814(-)